MEWETTSNKSLIDKFQSFCFGKTIGFIGTDDVGKSTLWKYIRKKVVDGKLGSTENVDTTKGLILRIQDNEDSEEKKIRIKIANDAGGQRPYHESREKVFKQSDYIIYVLRSDIFLDKNLDFKASLKNAEKDKRKFTLNAVRNDFKLFHEWKKKHSLFIIVGNYFGDFSNLSNSEFKNEDKNIPIYDKYLEKSGVPNFLEIKYKNDYDRVLKQSVSEVVGESNEILRIARWSVGSIVTEKLAQQLALDILSNFR